MLQTSFSALSWPFFWHFSFDLDTYVGCFYIEASLTCSQDDWLRNHSSFHQCPSFSYFPSRLQLPGFEKTNGHPKLIPTSTPRDTVPVYRALKGQKSKSKARKSNSVQIYV